MKIELISCVGADENNDAGSLIKLQTAHPKMEIGVTVSQKDGSKGTARYEWLKDFIERLKFTESPQAAALHVCGDWCQDFCVGTIAPELKDFMNAKRKDGLKIFHRIQLNFLSGREYVCADTLADIIGGLAENVVILPYNDANHDIIKEIYAKDIFFHTLRDFSLGKSILFADRLQGYASDFNPENVAAVLNLLQEETGEAAIYVDAEGGLKENGIFNCRRAESFVKNIRLWEKHRRCDNSKGFSS